MLKHIQQSAKALFVMLLALTSIAQAQTKKTNILFLVSDDTGYGDLGPYGGGVGRGMQHLISIRWPNRG
jgi:hypothetical protein